MIIRAPHDRAHPFFQMLRTTAQDENLTARALGVLAYLLSKPDTWEPTVDDICRRFSDVGREQAYKIISEIFIPFRYAERKQERDSRKIVRWRLDVSEAPLPENQKVELGAENQQIDANELDADYQDTGFQDADYQDAENQHHRINRRVPNTEKKDITEKKKDMSGLVLEVFAYWQSALDHPQAKLTPKRKRNIEARLEDKYTVEQIKTAIDGCASSPFHMGANQQGTVYDDIELICRDGGKLESFIAKAARPNGMDRFTPNAQKTVAALDVWLKRGEDHDQHG